MENYEDLAQIGDWESIQRLILMYADTEDVDEQRRIGKAFYLVKNRKQLIAAFFTTLDNVDDLQKRFVILKLALRISRPAFLYEYLSCSLKLGVKPKGTGLFDKGIRPLSEYEKREVCRHIIDHFDYRIQIIHLAGDENIAAIQNSAFACIETGNITNHIIRCLEGNYGYLDKCQSIILGKISSDPEKYSYLSKYLNINSSNIQMLLSSFQNTAMIWDATAHNIWLKEDTCISVPFLQTILKIDRGEPLSNKEKNETKQRIVNDIELLSDIDSSTGNKLFMFLRKVGAIEFAFQEKALIRIYEKTKIYSNRALQELVFIRSNYAYREMMNIIISTSNSGIRIRYALRIVKSYKEHISTLYSCAKSLHDTELIEALNRRGINGERVPIPDFHSLVFSDVKQVSIVDNTTIVSELLASLVERIDASIFFCAVGFAYKSGLRMILPIIDAVSNRKGNIELVIGSLQDYCNGFINKRMDRDSAKFIQKLLTNQEVDVYAYADAFYHGKFYYISNGIQTFALIGSSNISKTAYLNNYELNLLLEFEKNSNADKTIMLWYNSFKESCEKIENLDIDKFEEFVWNGIQDTISAVSAKKETIGGVRERISHLTDEETKYRLNLWLKYEPSDIYSNLNIDALANYMVFLYPEHELAVFESFELNNAYYTFHYTDFEELMQQVSALSKTQMLIASNFLGRGYHIQEKERLEERINKYFQKSHQFNI